jgi:pyridoxal phosphate enzyme (YggS family)
VLETINISAVQAGRNSDNIKLIAVSKTVEPERIVKALRAGVSIFGENRVQEAKDKITFLQSLIPDFKVEWHLIGGLQRNKAKTAVRLFDLIHSVDSIRLAEELNKFAQQEGKIQKVLVQVKLSDEPAKHGVKEKDLMALLKNIRGMKNLRFEGLMMIPPLFRDPERTRPYYRKLREIAEYSSAQGCFVKELSMGMSNDFKIAIEEGSTMVRVGTAIFGERDEK